MSCNSLLVDSPTYLLTINLPTLKSVAMSLYDIIHSSFLALTILSTLSMEPMGEPEGCHCKVQLGGVLGQQKAWLLWLWSLHILTQTCHGWDAAPNPTLLCPPDSDHGGPPQHFPPKFHHSGRTHKKLNALPEQCRGWQGRSGRGPELDTLRWLQSLGPGEKTGRRAVSRVDKRVNCRSSSFH